MNPLMVLFFTSIILEDIVFRGGKISTYFINLLFFYLFLYYLVDKSKSYSTEKKLMLASYSQSFDPTIYTKLKLDTKKAKEFIEKLESETGKKISMTLFFAKCTAEVFKKYPEFNHAIKYGALHEKKTIDISILVDVAGKDLAFVTLRDIPNKTFSQLNEELYPHATRLKQEKDEEFKKSTAPLKLLPSFVIGFLLDVLGYISNIGITIKALGAEANKLGSAMISSVGSFRLSKAFAPLCPFTHTSIVITICATKKKRILNKDGTITEKELVPINLAVDHRFVDGAIGAKMIREITKLFEDPEQLKIY